MKNYLLIILLVSLVSIFLTKNFSGNVEASQNAMLQKWEYRTVIGEIYNSEPSGPHPTESFGKEVRDPSGLTGWGREGWELVSVVKRDETGNLLFYFKRPLK